MHELLKTKLFIPRPRSNLVSRPRLIEHMNAGLDRKLTLIAAPAGFGKTTLLSEWIPHSPRCVTWLSLDDGDNDPARFWVYLIASVQQIHPDLGQSALARLQSPQAPSITAIITSLINDIVIFPDSFCTVLDDYHFIDIQPIHEGLAYLIDHLPANYHLVITTRINPPLPLARLRARGQMTELRTKELRFSADECAIFLKEVMDLNLSAEGIAALETRTEGWIAGLQLAALSMQGAEDVDGFIQTFTSSSRYIVEYLVEEVLNQRPEGTMEFLVQTSILERLCGSLCDAVTRRSGGQAMLEKLEQANLFIIPQDEEGIWYRYHHLFAEVLRARLQYSQPKLLDELHSRASDWYEAHNLVAEAIQHALAAKDVEKAASLIERAKWTWLGRGEVHVLHRWLDELPVEIMRDFPGLSLAYAWIFTILRQVENVEPFLQDAENTLEDRFEGSDRYEQRSDAIQGELATLRASIALDQMDIPHAIGLSQQALNLLPKENKLMLGFATYFLGHGEKLGGHMAEAEQAYLKASSLSLEADNLLIALHALANVSRVQHVMGRLSEAAETSQSIFQITADRQIKDWPVAGTAYYGLGNLYYEWNELDTAIRYSRLGIESGQRGGLVALEFYSLKMLALVLQAQNDADGADRVLRQIAEISNQHHHPLLSPEGSAWEARVRLRQGRLEQAVRWEETCGLHPEDPSLPYYREVIYLTIARVQIAQGQAKPALELLARLQQAAQSDQRAGSLIEILALKALARQLQDDLPGALEELEHALTLAEPEGYVRTFVDEGEPMRLLLLDYQTSLRLMSRNQVDHGYSRLLAYINKLLRAFPRPTTVERSESESLPDPLTEREFEVLQLIDRGLSNQEIAEEMVVAVSTVKSHINSLYSKLGTHRRTQAISIAKEQGLLSDSSSPAWKLKSTRGG